MPTPDELLRKLRKLGLVPQLNGLSVVHLGLGVGMAGESAGSSAGLRALKTAWTAYWAATGARLLTIGTPMPLDALPAVAGRGQDADASPPRNATIPTWR